jgi:hypothetical protein
MLCGRHNRRTQLQAEGIYAELDNWSRQMEAGYVPDTCFCMHDLDKHQKEWTVCYHIEKLAIAYSFMSTVPEIPIYVFEELWHML